MFTLNLNHFLKTLILYHTISVKTIAQMMKTSIQCSSIYFLSFQPFIKTKLYRTGPNLKLSGELNIIDYDNK